MVKKIIILIIVLLVAAALLYYFVFRSTPEVTGEITVAYLKRFPAGTTPGPGVEGTQTGTFYPTDIMGINGKTNLTGKAKLTFEIVDEEGEIVQSGAPGMKLKGAGEFGMCCITLPVTPGDYQIHLFLNGRESTHISFEVIE